MPWWNAKRLPDNDSKLDEFLRQFVVNCPCSIERKVRDGEGSNGNARCSRTYRPVSQRGQAFKQRGISGPLLTTILADIRRPLRRNGCYENVPSNQDVEIVMRRLEESCTLSDRYHDVIVIQERSDMPETETIFYCIRNSFAHGSFEVVDTGNGRVYLLESRKNDVIKAQMRLKEKTLERFALLMSMSKSEIEALRSSRTGKR